MYSSYLILLISLNIYPLSVLIYIFFAIITSVIVYLIFGYKKKRIKYNLLYP